MTNHLKFCQIVKSHTDVWLGQFPSQIDININTGCNTYDERSKPITSSLDSGVQYIDQGKTNRTLSKYFELGKNTLWLKIRSASDITISMMANKKEVEASPPLKIKRITGKLRLVLSFSGRRKKIT